MTEIKGWCMGRDAQGTPTLGECFLTQGSGGRYFMQGMDKAGNWITLRSYQLGETFFHTRSDALEEYLKQLESAKFGYQMALGYVEDRIDEAKQLLEMDGRVCLDGTCTGFKR